MADEGLRHKIEAWASEGLISPEQAEALIEREGAAAPARRLRADEILVYLGSLVIFLALAFLVGLNWPALQVAGRILSVLLPALGMLALGGWLRGSASARLRRGAQALWLGGCLLSGLACAVILSELDLIADDNLLSLLSSLLAFAVASVAFILLPSVAQSVAFHLAGSTALFAFIIWLEPYLDLSDPFFPLLLVQATCLAAGGLWLIVSRWRPAQAGDGLRVVSRLFGALTILAGAFVPAASYYSPTFAPWPWQQAVLELVAFAASLAFLAAGVRRQSLVYLYCGAGCLLVLITYLNFEHFADEIGMPVALFIAGALLVALGLGTERLRRGMRTSSREA